MAALKDTELLDFIENLKRILNTSNTRVNTSNGVDGVGGGDNGSTKIYSEEVKLLGNKIKLEKEIVALEQELKNTRKQNYIQQSKLNGETSKERTAYRNAIQDQLKDRNQLLSIVKKEIELHNLQIENEKERKKISLERQSEEEKHYKKISGLIYEQQKSEQAHYNIMQEKRAKFYANNKNDIEEINRLEEELSDRRQAKNLRKRKKQLELEKNTTDSEGRTKKIQSEASKKWDKFKFDLGEHSGIRGKSEFLLSEGAGTASNAISKFSSFMDKEKVSISDVGKGAADIANKFGPYGQVIGAIISLVTAVVEQYDKINKSASDYVKIVGGGSAKMQDMKKTSTQIASDISTWGGKAYKFDKILQHTAELSTKIGRVMDHMSNNDFKSLEDLNEWGISSDILTQYDTFGLSLENIDKRMAEIYRSSGKHGLNAKAVTEQVNKNLKLAQNYTFAGGLKALTRMAEKATALKIDMGAASAFADKVSTLEGAATTGAELSVLGGSYARMGNPLTMLYGGLQDEEKLFDMMLNATKGHSYWDKNKKQFDMDAFDKMQMKQAAKSMGIDFSTMWTASMNQARLDRVDNQMSKNGDIRDKDVKEYIRNISQIDEDGNGYVVLRDSSGKEEKKKISELTDGDKTRLAAESKRYEMEKNAKLGDILSDTRTITDHLNDLIDLLKGKFMNGLMALVEKFTPNKTYASVNGLEHSEAKIYDKIASGYREGSGFTDDSSYRAFLQLGLDKDVIKKVRRGNMTEIDFKNLIIMSQLANRDNKKEKEKEFANGGYTGFGGINEVAGITHGQEYVLNAKATQHFGIPMLNAMNAMNDNAMFKHMQVNPISLGSQQNNTNMQVSMQPLQINIGGKIDLTANGRNVGNISNEQLFDRNTIASLAKELSKYVNNGLLDMTKQASPFVMS